MSTDARYILIYENLYYIEPHPLDIDKKYLKKKYGGNFKIFGYANLYWDKPKYTLPYEEIENLKADQILERKDCELWKDITNINKCITIEKLKSNLLDILKMDTDKEKSHIKADRFLLEYIKDKNRFIHIMYRSNK